MIPGRKVERCQLRDGSACRGCSLSRLRISQIMFRPKRSQQHEFDTEHTRHWHHVGSTVLFSSAHAILHVILLHRVPSVCCSFASFLCAAPLHCSAKKRCSSCWSAAMLLCSSSSCTFRLGAPLTCLSMFLLVCSFLAAPHALLRTTRHIVRRHVHSFGFWFSFILCFYTGLADLLLPSSPPERDPSDLCLFRPSDAPFLFHVPSVLSASMVTNANKWQECCNIAVPLL